ncbi:GTP cyclohydrolase I type 1 [Porphyromonas crevioricanis JCM 15906]|nr:GTP cyclohydrolase I type 1 [Porphyromonas crevioricanis JCM 15906]
MENEGRDTHSPLGRLSHPFSIKDFCFFFSQLFSEYIVGRVCRTPFAHCNRYTQIYMQNEQDLSIQEALQRHYEEVLTLLGEDRSREGLIKTPERVAKAMQFLTSGYQESPEDILLSAKFKEDYRQMVIVKDIDFFSLCEHHMLPFFGKAHVGYIPNKYITGLSKIPRVVNVFSRRLQVQERLTTQIKECIQNTLNPMGVIVVIEAQHMCMQMRGVEKQNALTTTSDFTGAFQEAKTREEFLNLIKQK